MPVQLFWEKEKLFQTLEEFTDAYKVQKREKPVVERRRVRTQLVGELPVVVGEECHMHFVYFLKTPKL